MDSFDVVTFYTEMEYLGITIWIDGGWGVDALLGKQTRPHGDLDVFILEKDVAELRKLLESRGYKEIKLEIARPHNFVLGDDKGREIDIHIVDLDETGNFTYGPSENGEIFPATTFSGIGTIEGHTVKCISAEWMVKFHTGYKLREIDFMDVTALCEKFGIDYPEEYAHLSESG